MINIKKFKFSELPSKFDNQTNGQESPKMLVDGVQVRVKNRKELDLLYTDYCKEVNKKFDRLSKSNPAKYDHMERIKALKRCESCKDFINSEKTILCDICDDAYHTYCLNYKIIPKGSFECPKCKQDRKERKVRYTQCQLDETMNITVKKREKVI
jgi:hypothetical protein